jgi:predicted  nucleic acid-binding Zn-ribbon protein
MSDTPRTDAETWRDEMDHVDTDYTFAQSATVSADFARQLERELAEAREQLEDFEIEATNAINDIMRVKYQRDTLAEALQHTVLRLQDFEKFIAGRRNNPPSTEGALAFAAQALATVKGGSND